MGDGDARLGVVDSLKKLIQEEVLHEAAQLDESTALLESGVIDSWNMFRVLGIIEKQLGVAVPLDAVSGEDFKTVGTLADLVIRYRDSGEATVP